MREVTSITQRLIAYFLLVSYFLQSCNNASIKKLPIALLSEVTIDDLAI